jgi:nucleoside-diphosphate-sugar epimerase
MPDRRVVAVAGATGVVGRATARHLLATGARVIGLSRRDPGLAGVEHVRVDLSDPDDCRRAATSLADTTHLVYAAVHEQDDLVGGWTAQAHVDRNVAMLSCLLDAVLGVTDQLCHVVALQGTKAYGGYFPLPVPARESWPWRDHVGFYRPQQELLLDRQAGEGWHVTFLRPQVVFGDALGSNMNITPALGVYAALLRADGEPLHFPGRFPVVSQAVDADLLARAVAWSFDAPAARGETFNVTNGEPFSLRSCWPALAEAFGMEVGEDRPLRTAALLSERAADWTGLAARFGLRIPALAAVVGRSLQYLDLYSGVDAVEQPPPVLVSTVKIRQAGFIDVVDTEEMVQRQIAQLRADRVLPPAEW